MNIGNVGSSTYTNLMNSMNSQRFQSGKTNLSKDDISNMKSQLESMEADVPDVVKEMAANFDSIDTNGDGISSSELQAYAKANGLKLPTYQSNEMSGMNGNTPPALTKDKLQEMVDKMSSEGTSESNVFSLALDQFDSVDTDSDGAISFEELKSFAEANNLSMPQPGGPQGAQGGTPPALSKDQLQEMVDKMSSEGTSESNVFSLALDQFDSVDTDSDGKISFDEMQTFAKANNLSMPKHEGLQGVQAGSSISNANSSDSDEYEAADTNKDGTVSAEELQAYFESQGLALASSNSGKVESAEGTDGVTSTSKNKLQQKQLLAYSAYATLGLAGTALGSGLIA
jgi:Ca2+-binding EF-hand superfamily protein